MSHAVLLPMRQQNDFASVKKISISHREKVLGSRRAKTKRSPFYMQTGGILTELERLVDQVEESILTSRLPTLSFDCAEDVARSGGRKQRIQNSKSRASQVFKYGSRSFAVMLAVISIIYEALSTAKTVTKRDIYYRNVPLFDSQAVVDQAISRLASHLKVERHQLNVRAAAKGLARGPLFIKMKDGSSVDCSSNAFLIADIEDYESISLERCDAILVVEKEAIFQALVSSGNMQTKDFQCLLVTGKGCKCFSWLLCNCFKLTSMRDPDLYTRRFLQFLELHLKHSRDVIQRNTPLLCLVDADPHGFEIMTVYKCGSKAMANNIANLAVPGLKWLGVHSCDYSVDCEGLIPYTSTDTQKLEKLIRTDFAGGIPSEWIAELCKMGSRQRKAEIEILADLHEDLGAVIQAKILLNQWL